MAPDQTAHNYKSNVIWVYTLAGWRLRIYSTVEYQQSIAACSINYIRVILNNIQHFWFNNHNAEVSLFLEHTISVNSV